MTTCLHVEYFVTWCTMSHWRMNLADTLVAASFGKALAYPRDLGKWEH